MNRTGSCLRLILAGCLIALWGGTATLSAADSPGAIRPVTLANTFPPNDDGSTGPVPLGIGGIGGINFFGQTFTSVYVNNNGNITFNCAFGTFTPNALSNGVGSCGGASHPIIAPFFADVDTAAGGSPVTYGNATINGYNAFVVNYVNVAYYAANDRINSFQLVLLDRSDTGAGNFDIEFNYNQIHWETGSASGGIDGLGGTSAAVGYSNGLTGTNNVYLQLPGSLVNGALLDGGPNALVSHSLNSSVLGRYVFQVRNGVVSSSPGGALTLTSSSTDLGTIPLGAGIAGSISISGGTPPYVISPAGTLPAGLFITNGGLTGTPQQAGNYNVSALVTDSLGAGASIGFTFSVFGFTSTFLPQGISGAPYLASVGVAGGNPPYSFSFTGLPRGLTGNTSGVITGLITARASYPVTVTATEGSGVSVSAPLTLVFAGPTPITVPATTLTPASLLNSYSQSLIANGGAPPYTGSLSSGSLPQGMSLRSGGSVAGIPNQAGTFTFAVRATDYTGASAVGAVTLTVNPPALNLIPSSGALPSGMTTVEYPGQILTAAGGTGPYQFTISAGALPFGLTLSPKGMISGTPTSPGAFSFVVTVTDANGATATAPLTILIRSYSTDLLLSTNQLFFSTTAGSSTIPPSQQVTVQSTSVTTQINYSISITSTSPWFTVTPLSGTTPGAFTVTLNTAALALAASTTPYTGTISITCLAPSPCIATSQQVSVSLTVSSPPPVLNISSSLLAFSTSTDSPQAGSQLLTLQNTGGGSIGFASLACGASWCTVSAPPGSLSAGASIPITVTADPAGLSGGYYRTLIAINSSVGAYTVPVTIFVAGSTTMTVQPAGAQFQVSPGGLPAGSQTSFLVDVSSAAPLSYSAVVSPNATWLTLGASSGTASASQPGSVTYGFDTSAIAALAPQAYYATITVSIPGALNSPQSYEVVLNVLPSGSPQRPLPSPAGLLFITSAATAPPPQNVSVATSSAAPVAYQLSTTTASGGNWLSASPALGNATPGSPATAQVSVNPAGLQPGVYYGGVNYAFAAAAVRTVNVTLLVTPSTVTAHDVLSQAGTPQAGVAGCTPGKLVPAQTGLVGNFSAAVAWPTPLSILLVDDCGNNINNGQIVATFSNGDPPLALTLADPRSGYYAGTWTPRSVSSQVTINARASAPGLLAVTAQIAGSVTPNTAPVLSAHSTLHLFNPEVGAALAPGTLVQITGTALSGSSATAPAGTALPSVLNGTQVILGGTPIPIQSVTPSVITAQVPFDLQSGMQYQIIVSANGALTTPDTLQLSIASPGVSTGTAGVLTAYHLAGTAVTEALPAAPGEVLYLLGAGLGATDTPVPDGALSPASPPANAIDVPTLTINGEQSAISFAGLQPGAVGIYQVNFTVPTDAPGGDLTLVLSQNGVPSNSAVLPVKQPSQNP
jgi:uncharacterized protein (TIGR03437 family)